jgi:hypothetical protein
MQVNRQRESAENIVKRQFPGLFPLSYLFSLMRLSIFVFYLEKNCEKCCEPANTYIEQTEFIFKSLFSFS